ncbi:MAG: DNA recombination protein RmuC [Opitutales bacterium]|nr:DNA recombination protein RmuC [Opitutales bacterium]
MEWIAALIIGILLGLVTGGLLGTFRAAGKARVEKEQLQSRLAHSEAMREAEAANAEQRIRELKELKAQFEQTFKALSMDALKSNNSHFLELARASFSTLREGAKGDLEKRQQAIQELLNPVKQLMEQVDTKMQAMEKSRVGAYSGLQEQVRNLIETQNLLKRETGQLVQALRSPGVRGRWGEMQLKRAVEFAGMLNRVDFLEQVSTATENGALRPDMVIQLPNEKTIVVDAKVPLEAYLDAMEQSDDASRKSKLEGHVRQIRQHIRALGSKQYWQQFSTSPEFVVLFLPGESFFSAALEQDPTLIETGAADKVILATPTTLIALLKTVASGWREAAVAEQARAISDLGRELYDRICTQTEHMTKLGKAIERSVDAYNQSVRSLESRVLVSARKFEALPIGSSKQLPEISQVEKAPQPPAINENEK